MSESDASGPLEQAQTTTSLRKRRIVHVMYSFGIGGLENVIVQLINGLPADRYDHVVLSLTAVGDFKHRIQREDVQFIELHKPPGHAFALYPRIYKLLRSLQPDAVHTCNLAALEIVGMRMTRMAATRVTSGCANSIAHSYRTM